MRPRTSVVQFLTRHVVGPVITVSSLEAAIDGLFGLCAPDASATLGGGFVLAPVLVAFWGTVDEAADEERQDRIDAIEVETSP